jgi:hypothetical protein
VDVLDVEGDDPGATVGGGPYVLTQGSSARRSSAYAAQLVLVLLDRVEPDLADVVDRGAEADCFCDRLRARLELGRHLAPARVLEPTG